MVAEHAGVPSSCVPFSDVMGVPITFIDKYCPEQFEIIGGSANGQVSSAYKRPGFKVYNNPIIGRRKVYQRVLIRYAREWPRAVASYSSRDR